MSSSSPFDTLPEELVARILVAVPCLVRIRECSLVCLMWSRLVKDNAAMGGEPCAGFTSVRVAGECVKLGAPFEHGVSLTEQAAAAGHVACLQYAQARRREPVRFGRLLAALKGHADALKWLMTHDRLRDCMYDICTTTLSDAAIRGGDVHCLEYALASGAAFPRETACATAAAAGRLPMLVHLRAKGCAWTDEVCRAAATCKSVDCLAYAHGSGLGLDLCNVHYAIESGHNDVAMYLWANGRDPTAACMNVAARCNNLACFAYAHTRGISFGACRWEEVVKSNCVDIVQYAYAHGWVPAQRCLIGAARAGHLGIVQCLIDQGCRLDADVFVAAVKSCSMKMVKFLHEARCPHDERACTTAVQIGHVNTLRYLHEECRCPWNLRDCLYSAARLPKPQGRRGFRRYLNAHSNCTDGRCTK
ncbi:Ankyrin repeat domain containing protein [Pandoravirus salinus]|uniref:Ankyrin repeat domain containing protein n=1 Tax=Pandoravirus salinus TaxID=1349410 RepID=S4VWN5_9VIRU|nr:ankyrin repeat domain [Pandoravirus salinus]AGO84788.1 Ankyrin repeat domain containing protein [Pandoravirus salinus]